MVSLVNYIKHLKKNKTTSIQSLPENRREKTSLTHFMKPTKIRQKQYKKYIEKYLLTNIYKKSS